VVLFLGCCCLWCCRLLCLLLVSSSRDVRRALLGPVVQDAPAKVKQKQPHAFVVNTRCLREIYLAGESKTQSDSVGHSLWPLFVSLWPLFVSLWPSFVSLWPSFVSL
jgi:hypothetical protein